MKASQARRSTFHVLLWAWEGNGPSVELSERLFSNPISSLKNNMSGLICGAAAHTHSLSSAAAALPGKDREMFWAWGSWSLGGGGSTELGGHPPGWERGTVRSLAGLNLGWWLEWRAKIGQDPDHSAIHSPCTAFALLQPSGGIDTQRGGGGTQLSHSTLAVCPAPSLGSSGCVALECTTYKRHSNNTKSTVYPHCFWCGGLWDNAPF